MKYLEFYNEHTFDIWSLQVKHQRYGQWLMNSLNRERQDIAQKLHDTPADCFYDDAKVKNFWEFVANEW